MSDIAMSTGYMTPQELKEQERAAKKAERARLKRVEMDEKAERRRAAKSGFANVANPRRSTLLTIVCALFAVYCLFPFVYLLINATKTQADFTSTFGLGFGRTFALWDNIKTVFTYQDGIFGRWFLNTVLYVVVGAGGATLLAIMGGYALAKFRFPGRKVVFAVIIGAISVPGIALAVPQFLLFAKLSLTNTPWAMIIPSLISPFGLYLMWIFSDQAALMSSHRIEVTEQDHIPLRICLLHIGKDLLQHALCLSVWVCALSLRALLCDRNESRISVNGSGGAEDDLLHAMFSHHIEKDQCTGNIVVVVFPRLCD